MKRVFSLLLAICLTVGLCASGIPHAKAASAGQTAIADKLYELRLFKGTPSGYSLDRGLTRAEGIVLLLRMMGLEKEAEKGLCKHPFKDDCGWADSYVAYAYVHGLTKGTSATTYSPASKMNEQMFLTLVLRAMGYQDGANKDFALTEVMKKAAEVGLIASADKTGSFKRGDAVEIFWNALNLPMKGTNTTVADSLIAKGAITKEAWQKVAGTSGKPGTTTGGGSSSAPACKHTNETSAVTKKATCGADGVRTITCADCKATIRTEPISKTGNHTYVNGNCSVCGARDPEAPIRLPSIPLTPKN